MTPRFNFWCPAAQIPIVTPADPRPHAVLPNSLLNKAPSPAQTLKSILDTRPRLLFFVGITPSVAEVFLGPFGLVGSDWLWASSRSGDGTTCVRCWVVP